VADHIGVIARPERLLKFAILGGVLCHKAVVLLARDRKYGFVHQRKCAAGRPRTRAPEAKGTYSASYFRGCCNSLPRLFPAENWRLWNFDQLIPRTLTPPGSP